MIEITTTISSVMSGILLGFFYFGGLYLTLKHLCNSNKADLLTVSSFMVRSAVCLGGFYIISGKGLEALIFCLAGFVLSKLALIHVLGFRSQTRWV
ncbi:MAG: N-ATPase, AtpR subunit [Methanosaeta sp. PtaU1.Bin112]|nr:MAG: N-ATPase, AtpR subunit [Methanosaeta sp. PtaU1.Bin112]